jgi:glycosyltransferase involved in cell wall biosynthesis
MLSHVPLVRELGEGRVHVELADEFRRQGHEVETYDSRDAFPESQQARWHRVFPGRFARRARDFVRREGSRFDVIDALNGVGPLPKTALGFEGLVVTRSGGLYAFYWQHLEYQRRTWPDRLPGTPAGQLLARWTQRRQAAACEEALRTADLVNLLNEDELDYVDRQLGLGAKSVVMPLGLTEAHAAALAGSAAPAQHRLKSQEVVFVGAWSLRKGSADWGAIVRRTRALVPEVRFRFLGTWSNEQRVLADLGLPPSDWLSITPHYDADQLPGLLRSATVGALPSYIEGWPLGVLEQLGAGLPVVAYDVPGSRATLRQLDREMLSQAGDVERFSALLAEILTLSPPAYQALAGGCMAVASRFRWPAVAGATLDMYSDRLARLRTPTVATR